MNFDVNGKLLFSNARADHMPQSVKKYLFTGEAAFYLELDGRTPADSRTAPKRSRFSMWDTIPMWPNIFLSSSIKD